MKLWAEIQKNNDTPLSRCIKVYDGVFASDWCDDLVAYFKNSLYQRTDDHRKQADELQLIGDPRPDAKDYASELFKKLYPLGVKYEEYLHSMCHDDFKPYDKPLTSINRTGFKSLQVQKYKPEDKGYPAVHIESGSEHYKKYLAVILYLNDVKEGGETVFPMAGTVITPRVGSVAIWPAGLPFYHCGLKSKTTKYILTTWFEFI